MILHCNNKVVAGTLDVNAKLEAPIAQLGILHIYTEVPQKTASTTDRGSQGRTQKFP